jgi:hypothetical protein
MVLCGVRSFIRRTAFQEVMAMFGRCLDPVHPLRSLTGLGGMRRALLIGLLLMLPLGRAQNSPTGHIIGMPQPIGQGIGDSPLGGVNNGAPYDVDEARRIRLLNAERQKSLVADTVKLLKLANELNTEMAKEDASSPTPNEVRRIADIEKLARNVKEKMRITLGGSPAYRPSNLPQIP